MQGGLIQLLGNKTGDLHAAALDTVRFMAGYGRLYKCCSWPDAPSDKEV